MTIEIEGVAPNSVEAEAIAELQKEGHTIGTEGNQPDPVSGEIKDTPIAPKEEPKVEEKPKEATPKEEPKPDRTPTMVEAWKLKVAEDQKASLEKDLQEVKAKVEELSKQRDPISKTQKDEIADEIKTISEEYGVDPEFSKKISEAILKKAKPSDEVVKTLAELQEERELIKQDNLFSKEFDGDVIPLVKGLNLSDQALSQLKSDLKDLAFSETYAKVPLKEIFKLKEDSFDLKSPKKSAEGKGVKIRTEVVDLDNLSEEDFNKMSTEQIEEFEKKRISGSWR